MKKFYSYLSFLLTTMLLLMGGGKYCVGGVCSLLYTNTYNRYQQCLCQ